MLACSGKVMSLLSSEAVPGQKLVTLPNLSYTVRGQRPKHACAASGSRVCLSQRTATATDLAKFTYAMKLRSPLPAPGLNPASWASASMLWEDSVSSLHRDRAQELQKYHLPQILTSTPSHLAGSHLDPSETNQKSSSFLDSEIPANEFLNLRCIANEKSRWAERPGAYS